MTSLPSTAALGAGLVLSLSVLAGCGGGDDSDGADSPPSSTGASASDDPTAGESAGGSGEPALPLIAGDPCPSTVTITGAVEKTWDNEGTVSLSDSGPPAIYQSSQGATVLSVYASGNSFKQSVILADGLQTYPTATGAAGLEVDADGSGATLDVDASAPRGGDVHITATFTC